MKNSLSLINILLNLSKKFFLIIVPVILILNWGYSEVYKSQYNIKYSNYVAKQKEESGITEYVIKSIYETVYNDLSLIKNSDEFLDYLNTPNEITLEAVNQMFFRVAASKKNIKQIRYINKEGYEISRVNQDLNGITIVSKENLQDKSQRYYFESALNTPEDTMYISDFDLNMENGEIVVPYEPMVRFALPVCINSETIGFLIINYDGENILSILDK